MTTPKATPECTTPWKRRWGTFEEANENVFPGAKVYQCPGTDRHFHLTHSGLETYHPNWTQKRRDQSKKRHRRINKVKRAHQRWKTRR